MCRHFAYLGPPVSLEALVVDPPHGLLHQSWAPRCQRHGTVNADGFGVGWWDPARRPEPARYRRAVPMWTDRTLASIAGLVSAGSVLGAVRSATVGHPVEESAAAPFTAGPWLFSHNGRVEGWFEGVALSLRRRVSDVHAGAIGGTTDSEVLFALTLDRLADGLGPGAALEAVVAEVEGKADGRLNLLLGDGRRVAATTWGDTLFVHRRGDDVMVASEPFDDEPGWEPVPDRSVVEVATVEVEAGATCPTVRPLEAPP